jgi:aminoglycoside 6'-N-acetyltransferase I
MIKFEIVNLASMPRRFQAETAKLLHSSFRALPGVYDTLDSAKLEVRESLAKGRISRIAISNSGTVVGWVGGIPTAYRKGRVWELHPLVVAKRHRRKGIGRALVLDLEREISARGGLTLWVGSDDHLCQTSIGGVDLYPNVLDKLRAIRNLKEHPYEFYQKVGFSLVGTLPDASGFGQPDIFLAKRFTGDRIANKLLQATRKSGA